jgi:hypoxanthine phosphoribosyltransferase
MMKVMKIIRIYNKEFEEFISSAKIRARIEELASQLQRDLQNKDHVFLGILNGAFIFAADLMRKISLPCQICFVKVASYHGEASKGIIEELIGINEDLAGKYVVILEDIVDTGLSMDHVVEMAKEKGAAEIRIVTLLLKEEAWRGRYKPDYVGFVIPNRFVIGYGMDYNGFGRNLEDIYILKKASTEA